MPKDTSAKHTAAVLNHIAAELDDHAASLRAAAVLMGIDPCISHLEVKFENSRKVGLDYLRAWATAVKQAAFDARVVASQKAGVPLPKKNGPRDQKP